MKGNGWIEGMNTLSLEGLFNERKHRNRVPDEDSLKFDSPR